MKKFGELRERQFFGARICCEFAGGEGGGDFSVAENEFQVIPQSFSFVSERVLQKFQESGIICDADPRAFAGKAHGDESGMHFGRRTKRAGWNAQHNFGTREVLAERGEVGVFAMAGSRGDALRDFELNHDVNGFDLRGEAEKMRKNRRSDVVGQIAVDAKMLGVYIMLRSGNAKTFLSA